MNRTLRNVLIGGYPLPSVIADLGVTVTRATAGLLLAFGHGWPSLPPSSGMINGVESLGFPAPTFFAWAAKLTEFAGGILLALGLLTRPASAFILFTMLVAAFRFHLRDPFVAQGGPSKELALLYGAIALAFMFKGGGRFSGDQFLRGTPEHH